jgi:enamine deaminase RidA (YjgF/YER057c/UK114 family)
MPPVANYVPTGNVVFLTGTGPVKPNGTLATGTVGLEVNLEEAYQHARPTGLALLAILTQSVGDLDRVTRTKAFGMVNAIRDLTGHPEVVNGCSDLFVVVFGDRGKHARSAIGMGSPPSNIGAEIEAIFEAA